MSQRAGWCCTQGVKCTLTAKLLIFALGCCLIRNNGEGMQCINWSIMARHQWMWSPQQKSIMIHHSHTMTALPVITELQATKANQLTKQQSTPQSLCCIPLIDFALWKKSFLSWKGLLSGGECTFIASIVVRGSIFQWASFLCVVKVCTSAILAHVSTKMAHKQKWHWRELPLRKTDFVSPRRQTTEVSPLHCVVLNCESLFWSWSVALDLRLLLEETNANRLMISKNCTTQRFHVRKWKPHSSLVVPFILFCANDENECEFSTSSSSTSSSPRLQTWIRWDAWHFSKNAFVKLGNQLTKKWGELDSGFNMGTTPSKMGEQNYTHSGRLLTPPNLGCE